MKLQMVAILALGIALGAVLTVAADSGTTPDKSEIEALRQQVQALEARVEALERRPTLEKRMELLEKFGAATPRDSNAVSVPPSLHGRLVPETWSRREFNGMPYYVIPLGNDPNGAARLRR